MTIDKKDFYKYLLNLFLGFERIKVVNILQRLCHVSGPDTAKLVFADKETLLLPE